MTSIVLLTCEVRVLHNETSIRYENEIYLAFLQNLLGFVHDCSANSNTPKVDWVVNCIESMVNLNWFEPRVVNKDIDCKHDKNTNKLVMKV